MSQQQPTSGSREWDYFASFEIQGLPTEIVARIYDYTFNFETMFQEAVPGRWEFAMPSWYQYNPYQERNVRFEEYLSMILKTSHISHERRRAALAYVRWKIEAIQSEPVPEVRWPTTTNPTTGEVVEVDEWDFTDEQRDEVATEWTNFYVYRDFTNYVLLQLDELEDVLSQPLDQWAGVNSAGPATDGAEPVVKTAGPRRPSRRATAGPDSPW